MILIFGGAYQGKLEFAKALAQERRGAGCGELTVFDCGGTASTECGGTEPTRACPDFSADIICGLEHFARACVAGEVTADREDGPVEGTGKAGDETPETAEPDGPVEAAEWMRRRKDQWQDRILVITDVSQGIVPMDAQARAFREMNGRLMMYLAREAEEVYRVFCGIGKRID